MMMSLHKATIHASRWIQQQGYRLIFLIWAISVTKDWLYSQVNPYQYADVGKLTVVVALCSVALYRIQNVDIWHDIVILIGTGSILMDLWSGQPASVGCAVVSAMVVAFITTKLALRSYMAPFQTGIYVLGLVAASYALACALNGIIRNWMQMMICVVAVPLAVQLYAIRLKALHRNRERQRYAPNLIARECITRNYARPVQFLLPLLVFLIPSSAPSSRWQSLIGGGLGFDVGSGNTIVNAANSTIQLTGSSLIRQLGFLCWLSTVYLAVAAACRYAKCYERADLRNNPDNVAICVAAFGSTVFLGASSVCGAISHSSDAVGQLIVLSLVTTSIGIATREMDRVVQPARNMRKVNNLSFRVCAVSMSMALLGSCLVVLDRRLESRVKPYESIGTPSFHPDYVRLSSISAAMCDATVAMEDSNFYTHRGFAWAAMHKALRRNLVAGKVEAGGSTITQQLAKNLFLDDRRTVMRKLKEAALTWKLEHRLTKEQILAAYLNSIDYGMGQRGISAASSYYFHHSPASLTLSESAMLVGLVPCPPKSRINVVVLDNGRNTALDRLAVHMPERYSESCIDMARRIAVQQLLNQSQRSYQPANGQSHFASRRGLQ